MPGVRVPAVATAIAILRYLQSRPADPASLAEVARALGANRSTCFNILKTLQAEGVVDYHPVAKRYRLGPTLLELGLAVARDSNLVAVALPYLRRLVQEIEYAALVVIRTADGQFLVVDKVESLQAVKVTIAVGERFPPDAPAFSRAYLAWRPQAEVEAFLARGALGQYTPRTITDPARYRDALRATREQGYAVSLGEYYLRNNVVVAPVFDSRGEPVFLLATLGFSSNLTAERVPFYGEKLRAVAEQVTRALGGRFPHVGPGDARPEGAQPPPAGA